MPEFDGAAGAVHYRAWRVRRPLATVVFVHGVGEHSGLYDRLAAQLGDQGIGMLALDQIGHGQTAGRRGFVTSMDDLVADAAQLTGLAAAGSPGVPLVLAGHSLGGIVSAVAAARQPGRYAALVLSGATLSAPGPEPGDLATARDEDLDLAVGDLSADPAYLSRLAADPLVFTGGAAMADSLRRILPPAWAELAVSRPALRLPVLILHGGADAVSPPEGARRWAATLPAARLVVFDGARHDLLNETVHRAVAATIAGFIRAVAGPGGARGPEEQGSTDGR
jgi:alpha-beta hydrolase superfamily lysophospholipase